MSMPRMCGAVPSSLTVPVILPSPEAFTFWSKVNAAQQSRTTADSTTARLYRFVISYLSLKNNVIYASLEGIGVDPPAFEIRQGECQGVMASDFPSKVLRRVQVARYEVEDSLSARARPASTSCHG